MDNLRYYTCMAEAASQKTITEGFRSLEYDFEYETEIEDAIGDASIEEVVEETQTESEAEETEPELLPDPEIDLESFAMRFIDHSAMFYTMTKMGKPVWTRSIPTACILFATDNGKPLQFCFNPDFFRSLSDTERMFIMAHEYLHIILKHGERLKTLNNPKIANVAMDIVINHMLVDVYGFVRSKMPITKGLCWRDTIFKQFWKVRERESANYYYKQLEEECKKNPDAQNGKLADMPVGFNPNGDGEGEGEMTDTEGNPIAGRKPTQEEAEEMAEQIISDAADQMSDKEAEELLKQLEDSQNGGNQRGTGAGNTAFRILYERVHPKKPWESLVKKWILKRSKNIYDSTLTWLTPNKRYSSVLGPKSRLPERKSLVHENMTKDRIAIWLFLDTSGSCIGLKDRFFNLARSINPEKFDVRAFTFDAKVYDLDLKGNEVKGGGGTSFTILENKIQQTMKHESIKYPDSVWVITDGYGDVITAEKPEVWTWLLTEDNSRYCIPQESHIVELRDFC